MPFTADEFHDLVRLVEARPEWRVELRRLVLTDELLSRRARQACHGWHSSVSGRRGFLGVDSYDVEGPHGGLRS